jgi:hypothetical protein
MPAIVFNKIGKKAPTHIIKIYLVIPTSKTIAKGIQAIGGINLIGSIIGVIVSLIKGFIPIIKPKGIAVIAAIENPNNTLSTLT